MTVATHPSQAEAKPNFETGPGINFRDRTWDHAAGIVSRVLRVPSTTWLLIRQGWNFSLNERDFIRLLGFARLNALALLGAAEIPVTTGKPEVPEMERALQILGIRYCAVVLAINGCCKMILSHKPSQTWVKLFQQMMTEVEIGYKMGLKSFALGGEGGALMGFSRHVGQAVLLANDPKSFRSWYHQAEDGQQKNAKAELELFGCHPYQVAALVLQQFGFGSTVSFGMACGAGTFKTKGEDLGEETLRWKAAYTWLEALIAGRNYPAELELRNFFKELAPSTGGQAQNLTLQSLYTEISKTRQNGSKWLWHLPRPSYEKTIELLDS